MTTETMESPAPESAPAVSVNAPDPKQLAKKLRQEMAAVRLHRGKWGIAKRLDRDQVEHAAEAFNADAKFLGASKKLINSRSEEYRAPCGTLSDAVAYWKEVSIPYPEAGIRLIKRDRLPAFVERMQAMQAQLNAEATALDTAY